MEHLFFSFQLCVVLSMVEGNVGGEVEILSLPQKYQSLIYYGDSLYQLGEYKKAEVCYYSNTLYL